MFLLKLTKGNKIKEYELDFFGSTQTETIKIKVRGANGVKEIKQEDFDSFEILKKSS